MTDDQDPEFLMMHGYLRAAVFVARMELETMLVSTFDELCDAYDRSASRAKGASSAAERLRNCGWIDRRIFERIKGVYNRASRIVHGDACTQARASRIVREVSNLVRELGDGRKWAPRPEFNPEQLRSNWPQERTDVPKELAATLSNLDAAMV